METDKRVRAAAEAAGYAPDIINTDVLPSPLLKLALQARRIAS
jgi:hypothetical protein